MENHLYRTEVQQALAHGEGSTVRYSETLEYDTLYAAARAQADGATIGFARVAVPLSAVQARLDDVRHTFLLATLITAALAAILALLIAERTAAPIRQLKHAFERLEGGDLNARLLPTTRDEMGALTRAYNQMADHLRDTIINLASERARLSAMLEHMGDGVLITDSVGHVRVINPAALRMLGADSAQSVGRSFAQVARHHELIGLWRTCRERHQEQNNLIELDRRNQIVQAVVMPLAGAEPDACLVLLQDLTRLRQLETMRRDFVSNVSHELRTPLSALKALVDTLRDGALEDPPAARRFLDRMESEVDALTQMVSELLELSRIEAGQAPLRKAAVEVRAIVEQPAERLRPQAERAGLTLTVELAPDLPPVLADAERIRQVVTNLVHNAIKFTPPRGHITVAAQRQEDMLCVSVRDDGVGISAEDLPRIFERFYKADRARSGGGTGLGLAIAKHIIQGHGGKLWAESVEGKGSTFLFTLPLAKGTEGVG